MGCTAPVWCHLDDWTDRQVERNRGWATKRPKAGSIAVFNHENADQCDADRTKMWVNEKNKTVIVFK